MTERELHGAIPQLLALGWREFVQAGTIFLHDERARRFLFGDWLHDFHGLFILRVRAKVKRVE